MFSNEISGPVILSALFANLKNNPKRHYSYRGLLLPETIGSIGYMHEHLEEMRQRITAGWVLTCLADEGEFSYIPSRLGRNYADRMTLEFAEENETPIKHYSWLDRGSDERQYCSPGIDLPICSVTRTKYAEYPEYHTSDDNLEFGSSVGLFQSFVFYSKLLNFLELRRTPRSTILCEPQMGKRNLYPTISKAGEDLDLGGFSAIQLTNFLSYADGQHNLEEIAKLCQASLGQTLDAFKILERESLVIY
jgi:aminopeptidase-like protein